MNRLFCNLFAILFEGVQHTLFRLADLDAVQLAKLVKGDLVTEKVDSFADDLVTALFKLIIYNPNNSTGMIHHDMIFHHTQRARIIVGAANVITEQPIRYGRAINPRIGEHSRRIEQLDMLKERNISPIPKDFLGGRVGIINKKGTDALMAIKQYLPTLAKNMPYNDEYEQTISSDEDAKQTMVDVDMVMASGDVGAYRGGITLAENLPNSDKLSLTIGGGRRNVYHRQIRFVSDMKKFQERLDAILDKDQQKYYNNEADHWFTIGHENAHSLGPKGGSEKLGKYRNIIEENKADMGALAFVDLLTELGMYTKEQRDQILLTAVVDMFPKSKPTMSQAHRVRTVMQNKYFFDRGVYEITPEGKIHVDIEKVVPTAKEMLSEIIRIQIDGDFDKAEKYVENNFVWTPEMDKIAKELQRVNKTLNGTLETELADKLLAQ